MATAEEIKEALGKRWAIPHQRIEDTFNIRNSRGEVVPLKVPEPQRDIVNDGILGKARFRVKEGFVHRRVINKGRQIGFSIISAAEAILIAQDFPHTFQYYIATKEGQADSWLQKVEMLCRLANHYPPELGGGPILNLTNIKPIMEKTINGCKIIGLSANPASIRGDTAISVTMDEMAWMIIRKNQQKDTYDAIKYFLRQGGQLNCLSTPRTNTDLFMDFFTNPEKHGFVTYYKPVIDNWRELDINLPLHIELDNQRRKKMGLYLLTEDKIAEYKRKYLGHPLFIYDEDNQILKQNYKIPYPWVNPIELEKDRFSDIEIFKQENLGIAIDEQYKVLKGEWIYENLNDEPEWSNRKESHNSFVFGIDIAKQKDLFIITVFEVVGLDFIARHEEILPTGQNYVVSAQRIVELYRDFKPVRVSVDNTGGGIPFCDILETTVVKGVLQRVNFNNSSKANMAETLRRVAQEGRLHMMNHTEEHQLIIKHLLKVEKQFQESSTKYTGKEVDEEGRDDGFWSVALAVCDNPMKKNDLGSGVVMVESALGNWKGRATNNQPSLRHNKINYLNVSKILHKDETAKIPEIFQEDVRKNNLFKSLNEVKIPCYKEGKIIASSNCLVCDDKSCPEWKLHNQICDRFNISRVQAQEWYHE